MGYKKYNTIGFFRQINTEKKARDLVWKTKFNGKDFICPECEHEEYYQYRTQPEIRKCKSCHKYTRLRVGTVFENSKVSLLKWVRAIFWVMDSKRGMSGLELQRKLKLSSYETAWYMLKRIRRGLQRRDERYKLKQIIELDGSGFGNSKTGNQRRVLVGIETKEWIDSKGRKKERAGFAKVMVADEKRDNAEKFLSKHVSAETMVNTDAGSAFTHIKDDLLDYRVMDGDQKKIDQWLPWVHKFISNAKSWILGTHHGVRAKDLDLYLAEYTYRFNRRHDPETLFHRATTACATTNLTGTLTG